jgi:midasin
VSLKAQLSAVAAVATRWRRLELASWRGLLVRVAARHAAGSRRSWFHLFALLTGQQEAPSAATDPAGGAAAAATNPAGGAADSASDVETGDVAYRRAASLLEAFLQTSTAGEFAARLALLRSFAAQMAVTAAAGAGVPGAAQPAAEGPAGAAVEPAALSAALRNTVAYYSQFAPAVDAALSSGLAPLAKELKDFVALAKWEDRGYYAMRTSTEKASRQLHRLSRRAEGFLAQPAAGVLAAASQALGLAQLAPPAKAGAAARVAAASAGAVADADEEKPSAAGLQQEGSGAGAPAAPLAAIGEDAYAGAGELSKEDLGASAAARSAEAVAAAAAAAGKRLGGGRRGPRRGRRRAAGAPPAVGVGDMELGEALEVVEEEDVEAWRTYSSGVLQAAGGGQQDGGAPPAVSGKYAGRLPQLAARMARVLAPAPPAPLHAAPAAGQLNGVAHEAAAAEGGAEQGAAADGDAMPAAPAARVDDLASTAASRALALRGDTTKGARTRKKKALTDLLKALRGAGVGRRLGDVPAGERAVSAWFRGAPPDVGPLLPAAGAPCEAGGSGGAARGALSAACWAKADVYYFRSIARVQRLQAAAAAPHKDLSAHEVAGALRGAEHLLYLMRRQRAALGEAAGAAAALSTAAAWAERAAGGGAAAAVPLPPQAWARAAVADQGALLDGLAHQLAGAAHLLSALAGTEPAVAAKATLSAAAGRAGRYAATVGAAKAALDAEAARLGACPVVDAAALCVVRANYAAASELAADADSAADELRLETLGDDGAAGAQGAGSPPPGWDAVRAVLAHTARGGAAFAEEEARLQKRASELAGAAAAGGAAGVTTGAGRAADLEAAFGAALDATVQEALLWGQAAATDAADAGDGLVSWTAAAEAAARPERAAAAAEGVSDLLRLFGAACNAAWEPDGGGADASAAAAAAAAAAARMATALHALRPLLLLQLGGLRARGAALLPLHKATGKLAYVCSSLFCTLVQEGFCIPEGEAGEGGGDGEGGDWKEAEGTGMGEGTGAKDVSDQIQVGRGYAVIDLRAGPNCLWRGRPA